MGLGLEESLRLTVAALMQATSESQRELAVVLGLTQTQVSRRQAGTTAWSLRDCDVLAAHYGIGPLDLLAGPTRACEALLEVKMKMKVKVSASGSGNGSGSGSGSGNGKDGVAGR
ncbi:XRE family transcriptional regulator [Streptomyces sp. NPDC059994]|uniref:XRE family transcriptional regulator n=1 Tax=Streptomyces sp. NPDC059994 TaxID=3347029 RepID=UPI0036B0ACA6